MSLFKKVTAGVTAILLTASLAVTANAEEITAYTAVPQSFLGALIPLYEKNSGNKTNG